MFRDLRRVEARNLRRALEAARGAVYQVYGGYAPLASKEEVRAFLEDPVGFGLEGEAPGLPDLRLSLWTGDLAEARRAFSSLVGELEARGLSPLRKRRDAALLLGKGLGAFVELLAYDREEALRLLELLED